MVLAITAAGNSLQILDSGAPQVVSYFGNLRTT